MLMYRRHRNQIPTALIVTGPNVASQELLFSQISSRLKSMTDCLVITLRSMDASNLKAVLKKLIRVATNQKGDEEDELHVAAGQTVSDCTQMLQLSLTPFRAANF